jgi:hypothetical protein
VIRKVSVKKTGCSVARCPAGRVAQDKEKLLRAGIFENRLKLEGLSVEGELGQARRRHLIGDTDDRRHLDFLHGDEGNPLRLDAILGVGIIPVQAVEVQPCGSLRVLDAERVAVSTMEQEDRKRSGRKDRWLGRLVIRQLAGVRGRSVELDTCGKSSRRWREANVAARNLDDSEVRRTRRGQTDPVVRGRADGVRSGLQPFEAD